MAGPSAVLVPQASAASPSTVYVAAGGVDTGTCDVATSPCASLTYALGQVASGGTVDVAGTIRVWDAAANPGDANGVAVAKSVTIAQEPGRATAVLEGTGSTSVAGSILTIEGADQVQLDGLTIENGNSAGLFTGAAVTNDAGGTLTVVDCAFTGNQSSNTDNRGGGAIANALGDGATGTLSVTGSTFTGNANPTGDGGAINNADWQGIGSATITGSTFDGNSSYGVGGAIDSGEAGGVGHLLVTASSFLDNQAPVQVGAAINSGGDGGGTGYATVERSTFSGNNSPYGSAIAQAEVDGAQGTLTIVGDTFGPAAYAGESQIDSGANKGTHGSFGTVYAAGDLFDGGCNGNVASSSTAWTDGGYNASTNASCLGFDPAPTDAAVSTAVSLLGSPADNGGPTETLLLETGNPAVGLIPANASPVSLGGSSFTLCPTTDQRGVASTPGAACDAGAVQQQRVTVTVSGSQQVGASSAGFTYATTPPGVAVGALTCRAVTTGAAIDANLTAGTYTINGGLCSGTGPVNDVLAFVGAPAGFVVTPAPGTPAPPPVSSSGSGSGAGAAPVVATPAVVTPPATVVVVVSGSQRTGSAHPTFRYSTSPPDVALTGLACAEVSNGTPISAKLASGIYTVVGSSCTVTGPVKDEFVFIGANGGFTVTAPAAVASGPPPKRVPPKVSLDRSARATTSGGLVTVAVACHAAPCSGQVRLSVARRSPTGMRQLVLAEGRYTASAGKTVVARLRTTRAGRVILRRAAGRARWRATATATVRGGAAVHNLALVHWIR